MSNRSKLDPAVLSDFIRTAGVSYKQTGASYVFTCPRCSKKDKLYIRKSDGRFRCFYCYGNSGFFGQADYALAELTGTERKEVSNALYGVDAVSYSIYLDIDLKDPYGPKWQSNDIEDEPIEESFFPLDYYPIDHVFSVRGLEYLKGRGIPLEIAKEYNIRYSPRERSVIFPVENSGTLLGWQSRLIVDHVYEEDGEILEANKAGTSFGLKKGKVLMFSDRVVNDQLILCEGPIDSIKAHLCGGGNVCTMGKGVSFKQIQLIKESGIKRLYLALDPDAARETGELVRQLSGDIEIYHMLPSHGDPEDLGAMSFEQVFELYKNAPKINSSHIFLYMKPLFKECIDGG